MKATPVIKAGYVMMALNLLIAGYFWLFSKEDDARVHVVMFMAGAMLWILVILVWYKVKETEDR
jgi:hypothetical protein